MVCFCSNAESFMIYVSRPIDYKIRFMSSIYTFHCSHQTLIFTFLLASAHLLAPFIFLSSK